MGTDLCRVRLSSRMDTGLVALHDTFDRVHRRSNTFTLGCSDRSDAEGDWRRDLGSDRICDCATETDHLGALSYLAVPQRPFLECRDVHPAAISKPWTPIQEEHLREMIVSGMSIDDLSSELQRSKAALRSRCEQLGISLKQVRVKRPGGWPKAKK